MTYACRYCNFVFYRTGEVEACQMCYSPKLRPATETEKKKLKEQIQKERKENKI
jgi:hypothetical protein